MCIIIIKWSKCNKYNLTQYYKKSIHFGASFMMKEVQNYIITIILRKSWEKRTKNKTIKYTSTVKLTLQT